MPDRCEHTDLLVDECGHCTGRLGNVTGSAAPEIVRTFTARFSGWCSRFRCDAPIEPGDRIGVDENGFYVCEEHL